MDSQASWQAFACTGNILRYLDYKQQRPEETPAEDQENGSLCNHGSGAEGDQL